MIAMLLAGGQGSRLGVLTSKVAKPAVAFGGKYRIIDFPLSNCINSGVDTVGVLTQYQPLRLNTHIGIGIPWDLDRNIGGVTVLPPYEKSSNSEWYTGTANAKHHTHIPNGLTYAVRTENNPAKNNGQQGIHMGKPADFFCKACLLLKNQQQEIP